MNAKRSYAAIGSSLQAEDSEELLRLLDSPSIKIGDTAASLLSTRGDHDAVFHAIQSQRLRTALGRKRALFTLLQLGRSYPRSLTACLHLLHDKSRLVLDEAIFGVVRWCDPGSLPALEAIRHGQAAESVERAIQAIASQQPQTYNPYYADPDGRWHKPQPNVA